MPTLFFCAHVKLCLHTIDLNYNPMRNRKKMPWCLRVIMRIIIRMSKYDSAQVRIVSLHLLYYFCLCQLDRSKVRSSMDLKVYKATGPMAPRVDTASDVLPHTRCRLEN